MDLISTIDTQCELFLAGMRSPLGVAVFKAITVLGDTSVIIVLTVIASLMLWRSPRLQALSIRLVVAVIGASISVFALKDLIGRVRPSGLIPAVIETDPSFPSGHATLSLAFYGVMASILCIIFPTKKPLIITLATLLIVAVGVSRLYLGVHFPTDVLAGYLIGGVWVLIGIRLSKI